MEMLTAVCRQRAAKVNKHEELVKLQIDAAFLYRFRCEEWAVDANKILQGDKKSYNRVTAEKTLKQHA